MRHALLPLLSLALSPLLAAQQPSFAMVFVRNAAGDPVGGAEAILQPEPERMFAALPAPVPDLGQAAFATSNQTGAIRLRTAHAGSVLITTADGLGALVPRLSPKDAVRVTLRPMGTIAVTGDIAFTLWASTTDAVGAPVALPRLEAERIDLPAGRYACWAQRGEAFVWQSVDVQAEQTTTLSFDGPGLRLQRAAGAMAHPEGQPQITLLGEARERCDLHGGALLASLVTRTADGRLATAHPAGPLGAAPLPWPRPADAVAPGLGVTMLGADGKPRAGVLHGLLRMPGGSWQAFAEIPTDDAGAASLPPAPDGDAWLLAIAPDQAPLVRRWSEVRAGQPLILANGASLLVDVVLPDGLPAIDARLEYVPKDAEVATIVARCDGRGRADFGAVSTPGVVHVRDARFANQQQDLASVPANALRLVAFAGERLAGRARFGDGTPAAGAIVTLRDPQGRLHPAERAVVVQKDGGFAFGGLPADTDFALFASSLRDGRTWSGLIRRARAGDTIELVVRNEDPVLGEPANPQAEPR